VYIRFGALDPSDGARSGRIYDRRFDCALAGYSPYKLKPVSPHRYALEHVRPGSRVPGPRL
jgi:hypothetical protein